MVIEKLGNELKDKNDMKTEKDLGSKKSELLVLRKRDIPIKERHLIVETASIPASFILNHPTHGHFESSGASSYPLASSGTSRTYSKVRVVNLNRTYIDNLNSTYFKDTSSTDATWSGNGEIVL